MKFLAPNRKRGIALIMVMIIIVVFAGLASILAYSMKVETKLARNASWDTELEWLGRSGVEYAKFALSLSGRGAPYSGFNQFWAGGTAETNEAMIDLPKIGEEFELSRGKIKVEMQDCESKFNINRAAAMPEIMQQALILIGVDATEVPHIQAAVRDWIDRDDNTTAGGQDSESSYYLTIPPPFGPYRAKNGPIDDISELMRIKYITPEMFYGPGGGAVNTPIRKLGGVGHRNEGEPRTYSAGFKELFTSISNGKVNPNMASSTVLQMIPEIDGNLAQSIITTRNGPDGVQGNEDDFNFRNVGDLANVPGMNQQMAQMLWSRYFTQVSATFEVKVTASVGNYSRIYHALVRRLSPQQSVTLFMWWETAGQGAPAESGTVLQP
jgi:DNA uptake protein ComE-like DNA-binding protein